MLLSGNHVNTTVWLLYLDFSEMLREKVRCKLHKDTVCCFEQIQEGASDKKQLNSHLLPILQSIPLTWAKHAGTAGEIRTNLLVMSSYELLHMDATVLTDQQKPTFISSRWHLEDLPKVMADRDGW